MDNGKWDFLVCGKTNRFLLFLKFAYASLLFSCFFYFILSYVFSYNCRIMYLVFLLIFSSVAHVFLLVLAFPMFPKLKTLSYFVLDFFLFWCVLFSYFRQNPNSNRF